VYTYIYTEGLFSALQYRGVSAFMYSQGCFTGCIPFLSKTGPIAASKVRPVESSTLL